MIKYFSVFALCMVLFSCGGGSGNMTLPSPVPTGSAKGSAHDNILVGSTITVYNYTNGQRGAVLGTAVTNSDGNYSVSIAAESCPLLLEATDGYYKEETTHKQVNLKPGQVLDAVVNFTTKGTVSVQLTPFTHLAAGLAAYRIKNGMAAAAAIDSSNHDVSAMLNFDVLAVVPLDVTNPLNANIYLTNGHVYGFLSAAISEWTLYASRKVEPAHPHATFNSIAFAQVMYQDIIADGVLNGQGLDATEQLVSLSFGLLPINANVYRYAIAGHIIQFADTSEYNATGLTGTDLNAYAALYAEYSGLLFGAAVPLPFPNNEMIQLVVTPISANGWTRGTVPFTAAISSAASVTSTLTLDNAPVGLPIVGSNPSFSLNTDLYSEGVHTWTMAVIDPYGLSTSQTGTMGIDRAAPVMTSSSSYCDYSHADNVAYGNVFDSGSGVSVIRIRPITGLGVSGAGADVTPDAGGNWSFTGGIPATFFAYRVVDKAGRSRLYAYRFALSSCGYIPYTTALDECVPEVISWFCSYALSEGL